MSIASMMYQFKDISIIDTRFYVNGQVSSSNVRMLKGKLEDAIYVHYMCHERTLIIAMHLLSRDDFLKYIWHA